MAEYRSVLVRIGLLCLTVCLAPCVGYLLPGFASKPQNEVYQTNDFGARTIMLVVADEASDTTFQAHKRVRRTAVRPEPPSEPKIHRLTINGQITARFAETKVDSSLENLEDEDLEAVFAVQLPETAFISNFTMIIDGVFYSSEVAEKSKAEEEYKKAKEENKTAGHVSAERAPRDPIMKERGMEVFNVAINIKAKSTAQFTLTYQQLLMRDLGIYEYVASVRPQQVVDDLSVNIKLYEPQGVRYVDVYEPGQNAVTNSIAVVKNVSSKMTEVSYKPDRVHQEAILNKQSGDRSGMDGDFIIRYDVNRGNDAGYITTDGGFFVHYFSPTGMGAQPKNIIFVMDRSGSMSGAKIEQTRQAMIYILDNLRPIDSFQMTYFDQDLTFWGDGELVKATRDKIEEAKAHVEVHLRTRGSTDINSALVDACTKLRTQGVKGSSFIVFLTDGHPTAGVTRQDQIVSNVDDAAGDHVVIFSLGFGFDLNFDLLKNISYRTEGTVRRIYPGKDAAEQIKDFMRGVNTPLMYEIELQYDQNAILVDTLTQKSFPQYFNGSELIVAGQLAVQPPTSWTVNVVGVTGDNQPLSFEKDISSIEDDLKDLEKEGVIITGFAERLWAYLTIKEILRKKLITGDSHVSQSLNDEALKLALQYKLVTPVTSLIIKEINRPSNERTGRNSYDLQASTYPNSYNSGTTFVSGYTLTFLFTLFVVISLEQGVV